MALALGQGGSLRLRPAPILVSYEVAPIAPWHRIPPLIPPMD